MPPNPFLPFTPAFGPDFFNRDAEIKAVFERIAKRRNTAIVGNPHVGKTSLLHHVATPDVFDNHTLNADQYALVEIDFQLFGESKTRHDFWRELIVQAIEDNPEVTAPLKPLLKKKEVNEQALFRAFQKVGRAEGCVVAFVDEFDYLFNLPAFHTLDFLGALRAITMKSKGLCLITASRLSVAQMNTLGEEYKVATRGSDLFNYLDELTLGCFDEVPVRVWLKNHLPPEAVDEAVLLAGHHPLLLQLAGDALFDAVERGVQSAGYLALRGAFIHRAESQFQDVWKYLDSKAQIALIIFALRDLQGQAGRQTFNLEKAEQTLLWYGTEVKEMVRRGTLEADGNGGYRLGSAAFRAWLVEQKIVGTRGDEPQEAFTQWLHNKQFKLGGLITNEEIAWLQKVWKVIPTNIIDLAKKALLPNALQ
ncbi:MAG: ATP-binding protein [Chloroflexi bacterium]|nr:ATP-binding protein [Chloroflexota bacterium]